jgi:TPR repeat protein
VKTEAAKESEEAVRLEQCEARALTLFDLSAQQGNAEAYIQLGDFYYYQRAGLRQATRKKDAASFYQKAADLHHTQAIFNLGIMHEVYGRTGGGIFKFVLYV